MKSRGRALGLPEDLAINATQGVTYGGAGSAIIFGLSANEFAAVGGLIIAALSFAYNIWRGQQSLKIQRGQKDKKE